MAKNITYAQSGVSIDKGDALVDHIKTMARGIGGFGGMLPLGNATRGMKSPVLVTSTDGVGTKLLVADMMNKHDTIGIDCVAMVLNDLVVCGAKPMQFLDYIGIEKLRLGLAKKILKGIAAGCEEAGCPLSGGETAELPGIYPEGKYDLVGFGVGVVDRKDILDPKNVRPGDRLIGLASSGVHSNGFSLARKVAFESAGLAPKDRVRELGTTIGKALLEPTRIYVQTVLKLIKKHKIHSIAHITGGGIPGNLNRALAPDTDAIVDVSAWPIPGIFRWIMENGPVAEKEMFRTFNMGIGMILVVPPDSADGIQRALGQMNEECYEIGTVACGEGKVVLE